MILNYIILDNIRSYKNIKIEFPIGISLFTGDIGTGKSTVLMAIEFALFGLGSQNAIALLNSTAKNGYVILNFKVNSVIYEIKRTLKRGKTIQQKSGTITINGVSESYSASELKRKILDILKFNEPYDPKSKSTIYRYAVFTPQDEMKLVLDDYLGKRLETLRKAFRIEDYKIAVDNAQTFIKNLKDKMKLLKVEFRNLKSNNDDLKEKKKNIDKTKLNIDENLKNTKSIEKERTELMAERVNHTKKINKKKKLKSHIDDIKNMIKSKRKELSYIKKQINNKHFDIDDCDKTIANLKNIKKPTKKTLKELQIELKNSRTVYRNLGIVNDRIKTIKKMIKELSKNLSCDKNTHPNTLSSNIKILKAKITKQKNELDNIEKSYKISASKTFELNATIKNIETNINALSNAKTKCPTCENILDISNINKLRKERKYNLKNHKSELVNAKNESTRLDNKMKQISKIINNAKNKICDLDDQISILKNLNIKKLELDKFDRQLNLLNKSFKVVEELNFPNDDGLNKVDYIEELKITLLDYQNTLKNIEKMNETKMKYNKEIENLKTHETNINSELKLLTKKLSKSEYELNSFKDPSLKIKKLNEQINKTLNDINYMKVDYGKLNERMNTLKRESKSLHESIRQSKTHKQKYEQFDIYCDWLNKFFIPSVTMIEKQIMANIMNEFNHEYLKWFTMMIDDSTKSSRIDEDFTPIVEQDGVSLPIDYFSGGEKTSIALAYRLTLNILMRRETKSLQSNLLILDEPTDGFSDSQLDKVRNIFDALDSQQIIIVSHEQNLESSANYIFDVTKNNGISVVKKRL